MQIPDSRGQELGTTKKCKFQALQPATSDRIEYEEEKLCLSFATPWALEVDFGEPTNGWVR